MRPSDDSISSLTPDERLAEVAGILAAGILRLHTRMALATLDAERRGLERELSQWNNEVRKLVQQIEPGDTDTPATARLADLQERIRGAERRVTEVREQVLAVSRTIVSENEIAATMASFDPVWDALTPREQTRIVQTLVERVDYDGTTGKVSITFHPSGIKTLADELADRTTEDAA